MKAEPAIEHFLNGAFAEVEIQGIGREAFVLLGEEAARRAVPALLSTPSRPPELMWMKHSTAELLKMAISNKCTGHVSFFSFCFHAHHYPLHLPFDMPFNIFTTRRTRAPTGDATTTDSLQLQKHRLRLSKTGMQWRMH